MLKQLAIAALLALTACGSPQAGDRCSPENSFRCSSSTEAEALVCERGTLRAVTCRGQDACTEGEEGAVCDVRRARADDACPRSYELRAQCDVSNVNRALICRSGTWTAEACTACTIQGGNVACTR